MAMLARHLPHSLEIPMLPLLRRKLDYSIRVRAAIAPLTYSPRHQWPFEPRSTWNIGKNGSD
jgi:hypothetical protein